MSASTLLTSVVTGGSNSHATVAEEANAFSTDFVSAGVVGSIGLNTGSGGTGSFCVNADASPDMGVTIKAGQAYVSATPSGQNAQTLRVRTTTDYTAYTINANASGSTKYDWIYLSISATNANNPASDASNVASFVTSRSSSNSVDNGTPPTYGILLAVVTVANGASSITNSNISDRRTQSALSISGSSTATGWTSGLTVPTTVTANGNRSYSLVFNGVDITGTVSAGMRLKTSRAVPAPTQCTSLNGTTQYYNKTSPANMAQTDSITAMAWIKLSSYNGAVQTIASRANGTTDGWSFNVQSTGQVIYGGVRAADDYVQSYQSVPLNKWVHVAASINSSGATGQIYFDGVAVPTQYINNANTAFAAPTADLRIGAGTGGTLFFGGKIAQVAFFNAVINQATIQSYISQGLAGTETSLISAYSFNNSINDLNANANNLTANGSAVATNADSPFGGQADGTISSTLDYAIITKTAFSTNTTLTVQVPEGCTIPTSGGVSAVSYSTQKAPYNMPVAKEKWRVISHMRALYATTSNATYGSFQSGGWQLTVPTGEWDVGYKGYFYNGATGDVGWNLSSSSLAGLTISAGHNASPIDSVTTSAAASGSTFPTFVQVGQSVSSQTAYTMQTIGATTSAGIDATKSTTEAFCELTLL